MDQDTFFDESLLPEQEKPKSSGGVLSVGGIVMLFIAGIFDFLGLVSAVLILAAGIGVLLGRIVSIVGFAVIGVWQFSRSGEILKKKKKGEGGMAKKLLMKFLKKHKWKFITEALPVIGDLAPSFVMIVYSELKDD